MTKAQERKLEVEKARRDVESAREDLEKAGERLLKAIGATEAEKDDAADMLADAHHETDIVGCSGTDWYARLAEEVESLREIYAEEEGE